jgi:enoyl-CoA hydratase/carnithine racemase
MTASPETAEAAPAKIVWTRSSGIGRIIFNNPQKRNAVSLDMWRLAGDALAEFAADSDIRVVVLSGAGGKAFVSGADISKFESERATKEAVKLYNQTQTRMYEIMRACEKPLIAQIQGYCIGGGTGLAVGCDLRICSDNSRFGIPAARLGIGYAYESVRRLVALVGPAYAQEIFFTGRQFSAIEAYEMGLVNRVVPEADLEAYVNNYTETIAANAPLTIRAARYAVRQALENESERDMEGVAERIQSCVESRDYVEGRTAFMEKRLPKFTGI